MSGMDSTRRFTTEQLQCCVRHASACREIRQIQSMGKGQAATRMHEVSYLTPAGLSISYLDDKLKEALI